MGNRGQFVGAGGRGGGGGDAKPAKMLFFILVGVFLNHKELNIKMKNALE
jgi:hypothetical protein